MSIALPGSVAASKPRPLKLVFVAALVAFLLAALGLLSAIQHPILALFSLVPLFAAIGILRRQVWSAYGFALFEISQLITLPLVLARGGSLPRSQVIFTVVLAVSVALLFFLAGRSLSSARATGDSPFPWLVICCLFTLPLFFFEPFIIPTGSMEDTLLIGDRILTRVWPHVTPLQGAIVVFRFPMDRKQTSVKRVIGLPGDRIRITSQVVFRNGVALKEPYAVHKFNIPDSYGSNFPDANAPLPRALDPALARALADLLQHHVKNSEVIVPPEMYFVLGDNRDDSLDSRFWGFLRRSDIIGQPVLIYDSEEPLNERPPVTATPLAHHRIRWSRLFRFL